MIALFLFLGVNILMAAIHAEMIKDGERIRHGLWGGGYLLLAGIVSWFGGNVMTFITLLIMRKVIFDLSLNLFRGLPLFYVSKKPDSIVDKFHYWAFKDHAELYYIIYFIALIVLSLAN